jgi:hypothetical protein
MATRIHQVKQQTTALLFKQATKNLAPISKNPQSYSSSNRKLRTTKENKAKQEIPT